MKRIVFGWVALTAVAAWAQAVERPRPAGWEKLVFGGRFMDRFEVSAPIGPIAEAEWGGDNVKRRDVRNGIEDKAYSYWGGNIVQAEGQFHLFVARWPENAPKGHMYWPHSEIAHAVSDRMDGDFKVVEVLGKGHNPEAYRCKDGSWMVYCIVPGRDAARLYHAKSINGPWEKMRRMELDLNGVRTKMIEGESNFSFCSRPDGSVLGICRGGGIWLSEDGIAPFKMIHDRIYPKVAGRFEDPVLWRDEVQYHVIVNDWLGRVAWYITSPDGLDWKVMPGEAYAPGIARVRDGEKVLVNDWFKYERMKVLQDEHGRVIQANFAVIDTLKWEDKPNDNHSSKNITIPMNPGRIVSRFRKTEKGLEITLAREKDFDPARDLDLGSLVLGAPEQVAFGEGVGLAATAAREGEWTLVFPEPKDLPPVVELLGREKNGRLFFATCRTDGVRLK
ncbi:MAG: glycoside hydrolase family protein [Kiritimatiellia bacterium]